MDDLWPVLAVVVFTAALLLSWQDGREQGRAEVECRIRCGPSFVLSEGGRKCGCVLPGGPDGGR